MPELQAGSDPLIMKVVENDIAYALSANGVYSIYGSDPYSPKVLGKYPWIGGNRLAISGNTLVVDGDKEYGIVDITDPYDLKHINLVQDERILDGVHEIELEDDLLYVRVPLETNIQVIDARSPDKPVIKHTYQGITGQLNGITAGDSTVYAASDSGLFIVPAYEPNPPPKILVQPLSTEVAEGENTQFSIQASNEEPITYQWYKDGMKIDGAVRATLMIEQAGKDSAGIYTCIVTNEFGYITSSPASLYILPAKGDVNGTNGPDISDVVLVLQISSGKTVPNPIFDNTILVLGSASYYDWGKFLFGGLGAKININLSCTYGHGGFGFFHAADDLSSPDDKEPGRTKADRLLLGRCLEDHHVCVAPWFDPVVFKV